MARRSTLHNVAFTLVGQLSARFLALILFAVLARWFGPDRYGDIGVGVAFGTLFAVLIEPGLNPLLVRDGARDPSMLPQRLAEVLGYKLALIVLTWPAMIGLAWLMGYTGLRLSAVAFSGGTVLLVSLEDLGSAVLIAQERMDLEATLRIVSKGLFAALGLTALLTGQSFAVVIAAIALGQVLTGGAVVALIRRSGLPVRVRLDLRVAAGQVSRAWPLALTGALWLITLRLDQILASLLHVSEGDLGTYNAAVKIVEALILFPNALAVTFQPSIARAWLEGARRCGEEVGLAIEAALGVTLPIAIGGALLALPIATLVYGKRFEGTGVLLAWQLAALPCIAIQFCSFHGMVAAGALRIQTLIVATNLAVNVAGNLLLIPRLGILGSTLSAVAGGVVSSVGCLIVLHRLGMRPRLWSGTLRALTASLAMGAGVWVCIRARAGFVPSLLAGAAIYALAFLALGGRETIQALRRRRAGDPSPELVQGG